MQKQSNKNRNMTSHGRHNNQVYRIISEDFLAKLSNDELKKIFLEFRTIVNKNRRQKRDNKGIEIDFCYIQREIQNRKMRA